MYVCTSFMFHISYTAICFHSSSEMKKKDEMRTDIPINVCYTLSMVVKMIRLFRKKQTFKKQNGSFIRSQKTKKNVVG